MEPLSKCPINSERFQLSQGDAYIHLVKRLSEIEVYYIDSFTILYVAVPPSPVSLGDFGSTGLWDSCCTCSMSTEEGLWAYLGVRFELNGMSQCLHSGHKLKHFAYTFVISVRKWIHTAWTL